jgi:hypothetical protein
MESLIVSIETIGKNPELEFKSKKIMADLKKCKEELKEEAFSDAFSPDNSE